MRATLSFDGHGINGPDVHRSRLATFAPGADKAKWGPLFAAAPEMLEALEACIPWLGKAIFYDLASLPVEAPREDLSKVLSMAGAAVSKARGEVAP